MSDPAKFTGRKRKKDTSWTVKAGDSFSKWIITIGGIGTVVAVSTVFFLLLWVVFPLLKPASVGSQRNLEPPYKRIRPLHTEVDEYRTMGFSLLSDGRVIAFGLDNGKVLEERSLFPGRRITAASFSLTSSDAILGFEDGYVAFGEVTFETGFLDLDEVDENVAALSMDETGRLGSAMVQRISRDQFRTQQLSVSFAEPVQGDSNAPVILVDQTTDGADRVYVVFHED